MNQPISTNSSVSNSDSELNVNTGDSDKSSAKSSETEPKQNDIKEFKEKNPSPRQWSNETLICYMRLHDYKETVIQNAVGKRNGQEFLKFNRQALAMQTDMRSAIGIAKIVMDLREMAQAYTYSMEIKNSRQRLAQDALRDSQKGKAPLRLHTSGNAEKSRQESVPQGTGDGTFVISPCILCGYDEREFKIVISGSRGPLHDHNYSLRV